MLNHSTETLEEVKQEEKIKPSHGIILLNDDVNTFDHVIESLVDVCKHDVLQAEQCAFIVHYNGKCIIKNGSRKSLAPINEALIERGLDSRIIEL